MKQLTCEMCGSTEMLKQEGVFVCQTCGTKYTVEEAKKMMVEGTVEVQGRVEVQGPVTVDHSKAIENYYSLAQLAVEGNDVDGVLKYAEKILELDANRYEGYALMAKTAGLESSLRSPKFDKALAYAKKAINLAGNKVAVSTELYQIIRSQVFALINASNFLLDKDMAICVGRIVLDWINVLATLPHLPEKIIIEEYSQLKYQETRKVPIHCKTYEDQLCNYLNYLIHTVNNSTCFHVTLLRKLDPAVAKKCHPTTGSTPSSSQPSHNQPSAPNKKSGCYVATAVYGSYDCPEVWTLRRYRDDTLAETWYGRAFIKTYYAISPTLVKWFGHTEWFKKMWQGKLDRMVAKLQANGVESTPYEDKNW